VAEWTKAPVLKTGVPFGYRGFESHPLRQKTRNNYRHSGTRFTKPLITTAVMGVG
jgi:hypothetical protein